MNSPRMMLETETTENRIDHLEVRTKSCLEMNLRCMESVFWCW